MDSSQPAQNRPPPRHSSLAASPRPPAPPPPPLANSPSPALAWPQATAPYTHSDAQPPHLPTYEETRAAEPHNPRFGRYKSWVEKRAKERRDERNELRAAGLVQPSSWDLPDEQGSVPLSGGNGREEGRLRDLDAEKRWSSELRLSNPEALGRAGTAARGRPRNDSGASLEGGARKATQRLTRGVALHRIGSRFSKGIPEKPLCGMVLPSKAGEGEGDERFVLVGTSYGLYLVDLVPSLSSAISRLSTSTLSSAPAGSEDAAVHPLWTGLAVRHLELFAEPQDGRVESPKGIVLALVGREGEAEIRMWSLGNLVNLAKWRVYDQNSIALHLPSLTRSLAASSSSLPPSNDRRASSNKPSKCPSAPHVDEQDGGTGKNKPLPAAPVLVRQDSLEAEYLLVDSPALASPPPPPRSRSSSASGSPLVAPPAGPSQPAPSPSSPARTALPSVPSVLGASTSERLALPLEWATTSVPLPLPKAHSPILFFRLFRMPPPPPPPPSPQPANEEDSDSSDENDWTAEGRRKRIEREEQRGRLFLVVATAKSVYLYESKAGAKRTWSLTREFFAPSTPKFVRLVRRTSPPTSTDFSPSSSSLAASSKPPSHRSSPSSSHLPVPSSAYPPDLHLLLGLSHKLVLIRLGDSAVSELEISPSPSLPTSTGAAAMGRSRSASAGSASSAFSSTTKHRPTASLASLASSVKERVAALPVAQKLQNLAERKEAIPAGVRGDMSGLVAGRRARDQDGAAEQAGGAAASAGKEGKWVGAEELVVPASLFSAATAGKGKGKRRAGEEGQARLYLLTRGHSTFVLPFPLPSSLSSSGGVDPLWTFSWPTSAGSKLTTVVAALSSSPAVAGESKYAYLALTAFSATGLSVQEGLVPLSLLSSPPSAASTKPFFRPLPPPAPSSGFTFPAQRHARPSTSSYLPRGAEDDDDDDDLADTATLDFGRETGWLCVMPSSGGSSSGFFWTRQHSDYAVKRLTLR